MKAKSLKKKPASRPRPQKAGQDAVTFVPSASPAGSRLWHQERRWQLAAAAIVLAAAAIRFYQLALVPLHHDEGVNGIFLTTLFRTGIYRYDPANYHGPSLYYFGLVATGVNSFLFGKAGFSTAAIRFVPAIFGIATVWLTLQLRRYLGRWGALGAAALLAVSPGAVYFSRYFIHEMLFVFFTLGIVVAILRYQETRRRAFLLLLAASAALLFATKETAVISVAVLGLAYACATGYLRLGYATVPGHSTQKQASEVSPPPGSATGSEERNRIVPLLLALGLFAGVYLLFYSSFGVNFPRGIYDSVITFRYWLKTGTGNTLHDRFTYLQWLAREEMPLLWLGALGFAWALYRARNRFVVFAGFWAAGMLCAYSLIPYKTPWLALNIILPLALVCGYVIEEICRTIQHGRRRIWVAFAVVPILALVFSARRAVDISFFRYDDDSVAYVYAHTLRQFLPLVDKITEISAANGTGKETHIAITSPDYWPLPWYLRNYPNAGYWGKVVATTAPIVIGRDYQVAELQRTLGPSYKWVGSYELRPGIMLVVFCLEPSNRNGPPTRPAEPRP